MVRRKKEKKAETTGCAYAKRELRSRKVERRLPADKIATESNVRPEKSGKDKVCERIVIE